MFFKVFVFVTYLLFLCESAFALADRGITLFAENLTYDEETKIYNATNKVIFINEKYVISADQLIYDTKYDRLQGIGNVIVQDNYGNFLAGNKLVVTDNFKNVSIDDLSAKLSNQISLVAAQKSSKDSENNIDIEYGCYTACSVSKFKNPIWQIKAKSIHVDAKKEVAIYKNIHFEVFGVPVMFLPYFSYPTPNAKAKSGILAPSSVDTKDLRIPFYFRAKPNLDFTITPRIVPGDVVLEGQMRHKIKSGSYQFDGSLLEAPSIRRGKDDNITKDKVMMQYHIIGNGSFNYNNINTGFNIKRASEAAYIRKYYFINDSYFDSSVYAQNINQADYTRVSALYLQDLRSKDDMLLSQDQFVLPNVQIKRFIPLEYVDLTVDSNSILYKSGSEYEALRFANIFNLYKSYDLGSSLLELNFHDKLDFYKYKYSVDDDNINLKSDSSFVRNVPEIHASLRHPIIFKDIIIEPVVSLFSEIGKNKAYNILPIDSENTFEINDMNVMNYNKFSGLDKYESGSRISYGVNLHKILDYATYMAFLGKSYSNNYKDDLVGSFSVNRDKYELYYRLSLNNKMHIKMQELGFTYNVKKLDFSAILFQARDVDNQLGAMKNTSSVTNKLQYRVNENWAFDFSGTFDVANKAKTLIRSFGVTYDYDCVRISARISDDFTEDLTRNIKPVKGKTVFRIGLKTINM